MTEPLPDLTDYLDDLTFWRPRDQDSATALQRLSLGSPELHPLAEFHADHGRRAAIIAFDSAAVWDEPGHRSIVALRLERDLGRREFSLRAGLFPTQPLAARWLASLGVPIERIEPITQMQRTTDLQALRIEDDVSRSGTRYRLLYDYTHADEVWTVFQDRAPGDLPPFLAHREVANDASCETDYHVHEARFETPELAQSWLIERDGPLPAAGS